MSLKAEFLEYPSFSVPKFDQQKRFKRTVTLQSRLVYRSAILADIVTIDAGFVSDGASVPKVFWSRYPPLGKYLESAVVHDYYCVLGEKGVSPIDFKAAAKVFREAMKVQGVSSWKRNVMYQAVRWFGPKFKDTTP